MVHFGASEIGQEDARRTFGSLLGISMSLPVEEVLFDRIDWEWSIASQRDLECEDEEDTDMLSGAKPWDDGLSTMCTIFCCLEVDLVRSSRRSERKFERGDCGWTSSVVVLCDDVGVVAIAIVWFIEKWDRKNSLWWHTSPSVFAIVRKTALGGLQTA